MHSLGSCVLHPHIDNKAFPTVFEVTNMTGPIILGRTQAKAVDYVQFPQIQWPHASTMFPTTFKKLCITKTPTSETVPHGTTHTTKGIQPQVSLHKNGSTRATQAKQSKQTTQPVLSQIKWNTDSIELNGKTYKLLLQKTIC